MEKEHDKKRVHPTQKPSLLVEWFLEKWGKESDIVADLFGGSGSTLLACQKINRECYTMELSESYCDVIIRRWEAFTGESAIHQESNLTFAKTEAHRAK
jgi:DNA modification methylase